MAAATAISRNRIPLVVSIVQGRFREFRWKCNRRFFYRLPSRVSLEIHRGSYPEARLRRLVRRGLDCGLYINDCTSFDWGSLQKTYFDICRALTHFKESYPEHV